MDYTYLRGLTRGKELTYSEYVQNTVEEIANTDILTLDDAGKERLNYKKLNLQRINRIEKTCIINDQLALEIFRINRRQFWLVISETWCGDSAQNIPYIAAAAKINDKIELKIIARDSSAEVMDNYLTNGSRSIPKLIAFDEDGNEIFRWGPMPLEAKNLVNELKKQGLEKKQWQEKLHLWYAKNKGAALQDELLEKLSVKTLK